MYKGMVYLCTKVIIVFMYKTLMLEVLFIYV